nr:hypothetical protein [Chloroflexota bacterium]
MLGSAYRVHLQTDGPPAALLEALRRLSDVVEVRQDNHSRYQVAARNDVRAEAANAVVTAGGRLLSLDVEAPSLDDIYARYFEEVEHVAAAEGAKN